MDKIKKYFTLIGILLVPLFFFPQLLSAFELPKLLVALFFVLVGLVICSLKIIFKGSISFKTTSLDLPIFLLGAVYLLTAIFITPNKLDAFFIPGNAAIIILGVFYYYLTANQFSKDTKTLSSVISISAILVSVSSLIFASGILAKIPQLPSYFTNNFSLLGAKLPEAIFLISVIPLGISLLINTKDIIKKSFWGISLAVVGLSAVLSVYSVLPGKPSSFILPSFKTSWSVAVDTVKNSPLLGAGPGNYITAYNMFKPVSANLEDAWNISFATSRSFLFNVLTEVGIIGFLIFLILIFQIVKYIQKYFVLKSSQSHIETGIIASLSLFLISLVFFPLYLTSVIPLFVLLSAIAVKHDVKINLKTVNESEVAARLPAFIVSGVFLALIVAVSFNTAKLTFAEYNYAKGLTAVNDNSGKIAYESVLKAINLSPKSDRYHMSLSQINMALASAIAQNKDLTDTDKTAITQLISQAISEAKNGVSLNPQRAGNWENLARVYRSIMAFAEGSDNFAIQSYTQAIALNPVNPNLRIALGGVYYALGRYDEAINVFQLAVLAKNDLANAHYNLAATYKEKNEISKAVDEMNIVLSLVEKDSNDYKLAQEELTNLQKRLPLEGSEESQNLNLPEKQEQIITPPLELPEEANPPEAE